MNNKNGQGEIPVRFVWVNKVFTTTQAAPMASLGV